MQLKKLGKVAVATIGLVALGDALVYHSTIDYVPVAAELPKAITDFRAAGLYWTIADVGPPLSLDDPQNAAAPLTMAAQAIPWGDGNVPMPSDIYDRTTAMTLQTLLKPYEASLAMAKAASKCPHLDFGESPDELARTTGLRKVRSLVSLICTRARAEAILKNVPASNSDLKAVLNLSQLVGSEPLFYSFQEQTHNYATVLTTIQQCAMEESKNVAQLKMLVKLVDSNPVKFDVQGALKRWLYMQMTLLQSYGYIPNEWVYNLPWLHDKYLEPVRRPWRDGSPDGVIQQAYFTRYLQTWTKAAPLIKLVADREGGKEIDDLVDVESKKGASSAVLAEIPKFDGFKNLPIEDLAQRRVVSALIESLIIRDVTGAFPSRIEEIPGNTIDPFTYHPLLLERTKNELQIYSVGAGGKDDGGLHSGRYGDDIIAAYPAVTRTPKPIQPPRTHQPCPCGE